MVYPHSILMQESKDMREKNIEPELEISGYTSCSNTYKK
jgi:hypothetical protein